MTAAAASEWDSDVFGVRVGLLAARQPLDPAAIRRENGARFDVVFVRCGGWADPGAGAEALDHQYDMELRASAAPPAPLAPLSAPGPRHLELARTAFHDSRFLRDPRLAARAPDLYARWVSGKRVHVLEAAPDDAFLLPARDEDGARRVSLVAVDERRRGTGAGRALMAGALQHDPFSPWRVMVSARNHRAIRFYEGLGFMVRAVRTVFHVWAAEGVL